MNRRCVHRAVVGLFGLFVLGCGVPIEQQAQPIPTDQVPVGLRPTDSTIEAPLAESEPTDIWFVRDTELVTTRHRIEPPVTAQAALAELLTGPTNAEQNRSLRSAIPDGSVVIDVQVLGGVATVDLASSFSDIPAQDQVLAVGQIVLTLTDLRGIGRVGFVVDEVQIAVPLPSGVASDGSVSRDDYIALAYDSA